MRRIDNIIQNGFMRRRGFRGRWLTIYLHRYGGKAESTERFHAHPWRWAFGLVLSGRLVEDTGALGLSRRAVRRPLSLAKYRNLPGRSVDHHRVVSADGLTLFVGFLRHQDKCAGATAFTREGWAHYTELGVDEPWQNPKYVLPLR